MDNREKKLSDYIDSLNKEKKPIEHDGEMEELEMEELFQTVRLVRGLKEPVLPEGNYTEKLTDNINEKLINKGNLKRSRKRWFFGAASAAAIALIIILNIMLPLGNKNNIVYAMDQAFKEVKAYHGVMEIVETNEEGKSTMQSKLEVWADRKGNYYVKALEGTEKGLVTVNNGERKWQIKPEQKEVNVFASFPDSYNFIFNIGKEIEDVRNALRTKVIGEDTIAGRKTTVLEVTPQGGKAYKLWIDKDTKMPLQKQSAMEYSLQYKVRYTNVSFNQDIPEEFLSYSLPRGFKEIDKNHNQVLNSLEEAREITGFKTKALKKVPDSFFQNNIEIDENKKIVKMNYTSQDKVKKISILQQKASSEFKPVSMATLGKVNNSTAEIQSPIQGEAGVLQGGVYGDTTNINSVRWREDGIEYAVIGNVSLEDLSLFIKQLINGNVELSSQKEQLNFGKPQIEVPVNLEAEEGDQKNADSGHSPWKLDPAFVTQVFVSLKVSPDGIKGDYPIKYEDINIIQNNGKEAVAEVSGNKTTVKRVYLKRIVRQDSTGIWTVVGYDPVNSK